MIFIPILIVKVAGLGYDNVGIIYPKGELAVSNSITNAGQYADYNFTFSTTNGIPAEGVLSITFPSQFDNNLGVAGNPACSESFCSLEGYTVKVLFKKEIVSEKVYSVIIYSLKNPKNPGGTGNFKMYSSYSGYMIDMNYVFATVGIEKNPSLLTLVTVDILKGFSYVAGDITKFIFTFQTNQIIPAFS